MDVERSSLCNCFVNFLLEENYLLTAFELLHELLEDGRDAQAIRLKNFFSDPSHFPPDQVSRFVSIRVPDPQTLLEEREAVEEKLAICEYELRLAREDILKLNSEVQAKTETVMALSTESNGSVSVSPGSESERRKAGSACSDMGLLKDNERRDLNCAIKEYLLIAGYRLTAMTFYEEVTDQNLDVWQNSPACVADALRHYYYQYLSSTTEAAEEKIAMLRETESLHKETERLIHDKESLQKTKDVADSQIHALTKSVEALQKDLKDKENQVQSLKQSWEHQRMELNECRAEITALKMHIEGSCSGRSMVVNNVDQVQSQSSEKYKEEIKSLQMEIEELKAARNKSSPDSVASVNSEKATTEERVVEIPEDKGVISHPVDPVPGAADSNFTLSQDVQSYEDNTDTPEEPSSQDHHLAKSPGNDGSETGESVSNQRSEAPFEDRELLNSAGLSDEPASQNTGLRTIQILADALPKIVPYVLINHREELLPLIMCAIERHPDGNIRDSLTHTLFNLIKRPDEQQRLIIMDACVTLSKNVGQMRTETELLPQCWEQINHTYEERRLLVAQSCGQLAEFVRPEIRDSLILSIVQQLLEDPATVVREAAAHNLALLLPLFPSTDKYFKVEDLMFQLVCDPSGLVVETALRELVPAVINWGKKLDHILRVLLSHILSSVQRCPPLSGVKGSVESKLHVLGERERWNVDVLLRMLTGLLPFVHQKAVETCPFPSTPESPETIFSSFVLEQYAAGRVEWPGFEWMHVDCFPCLIHLTCLLPQKEDRLRNRITKFLLAVSENYGNFYLTHVMLPLFLVAVGENADLTFFPSTMHSRIKALKPRTAVAEKLCTMCVLPLLLAGILGAPSKHETLSEYLRNLLVQNATKENQLSRRSADVVDAVRFLCTFQEHHVIMFDILWEMVVSPNINMKISAATLLKVTVPYIDAKTASTNVLPALVTLGSDQNQNVKYASIEAFGAVAQHFKNDMIVDKIRVQMDAFLEDGSHEATIAVVRALLVAVPHTNDRLRDYLLSKIYHLSATPNASSEVMHRRERANAFCEAIRALDATDLPANSVRDFLLPAIQNLFKDLDSVDPAHKEALEIIVKERSGGTFDALSKVMGAHLGLATSVSSIFGEGRLLGKNKEGMDPSISTSPVESPRASNSHTSPPADDTRFRRIMRGNFSDMLRGAKAKSEETAQPPQ